jgi:hypothetical protein
LPLKRYDFTDLYNDLTTRLVRPFDVAEACLKYATWSTRNGYRFNSAGWNEWGVTQELQRDVPLTVRATLDPAAVPRIADTIDRAKPDSPRAAWVTAKLISRGISQKFTDDRYVLEHELKDLEGFAVPPNGAEMFYSKEEKLSARPGPNRNQYDPSAVEGLALWRDEPLFHGDFKVIVDRTCAAQLDVAIGDDGRLKVALIQPNRSLLELSVTTVSPESDTAHRFFGVGPRRAKAQTKKILKGLKLAAAAGAGIALLPELITTKAEVDKLAAELSSPGNIIPHRLDKQTLRVVVSGSYHHVDTGNEQRNTTKVFFPRSPSPMLQREHSKSGMFVYFASQSLMEAWKRSPWILHWPAAFALIRDYLRASLFPKVVKPPENVGFREDVEPSKEIRLFAGPRFSVVVVICADLLNRTFRRVLETLQPSLILVCNMTPKQGDFASAAHALILDCQSTLVGVNNPARWSGRGGVFGTLVSGGMAGLPVRDGNKRVIEAHVPSNKILIFDPKAKKLHEYPG